MNRGSLVGNSFIWPWYRIISTDVVGTTYTRRDVYKNTRGENLALLTGHGHAPKVYSRVINLRTGRRKQLTHTRTHKHTDIQTHTLTHTNTQTSTHTDTVSVRRNILQDVLPLKDVPSFFSDAASVPIL